MRRMNQIMIWTLVIGGSLYSLATIFSERIPEFFRNYLNDFLCLPLLLSCFVCFIRTFRNRPTFGLQMNMILFACLYLAIVFEYLLPQISNSFTSDSFDVIAYALGGIYFACIQNFPQHRIKGIDVI